MTRIAHEWKVPDKKVASARPIAHLAAAGLILVLAASPGQASALHFAQRLCGPAEPGEKLSSIPDAAALIEAGRRIESRAASLREAPETKIEAILGEAPSGSGDHPDAAAIATYCAAAGDAMRLASWGSQAQAIDYLLAAFRRAGEAGRTDLVQLSAYRLALVGVAEPALAGVRGAGPRRAQQSIPLMQDSGTGEPACDRVGRIDRATTRPRDLAELALICASGLAGQAGDPRLASLVSLRLAKLLAEAADEPGRDGAALRQAARDAALAGMRLALAVPIAAERADLLDRLAELAVGLRAGDDPALVATATALSAAAAESGEAGGLADALEARRALARGETEVARRAIESAILAESRRPLPARLPGYFLLLSRADPEQAIGHVEAAYAALEAVRPLLPRLDPLTEESSFSLRMRDVFAAAVDAQLATARGPGEAVGIRRAQQIVEAYRQAELQSAFGSACLPPRQPLRPHDLRPGEVILYPLLLRDRVELLYVAGAASKEAEPVYRRLPPDRSLGRDEVGALVEQVVISLNGGDETAWRPAARRLHDLLIAPLEDRLGPGSMLAIVPDGPLRSLPFAALTGPDGRYLIEKTRLTLLPALDYSQPGGARRGDRLRVVAASLDRPIVLPAGVFPALVGTRGEAEMAVSNAAAGVTLPNFTRNQLIDALAGGRVDVLHLATHAAFNGRSDRAFIVARDGLIRLAELRELIERSNARGETLDLIVLSACETAIGDDEVNMGLSGAVVQAGARSVIGSLWQVSDIGTTRLMAEFYRRYGAGDLRSSALRDAQLALIRGGGEHASPNVWAAFTLLGAWR